MCVVLFPVQETSNVRRSRKQALLLQFETATLHVTIIVSSFHYFCTKLRETYPVHVRFHLHVHVHVHIHTQHNTVRTKPYKY